MRLCRNVRMSVVVFEEKNEIQIDYHPSFFSIVVELNKINIGK